MCDKRKAKNESKNKEITLELNDLKDLDNFENLIKIIGEVDNESCADENEDNQNESSKDEK